MNERLTIEFQVCQAKRLFWRIPKTTSSSFFYLRVITKEFSMMLLKETPSLTFGAAEKRRVITMSQDLSSWSNLSKRSSRMVFKIYFYSNHLL